MQDAAAEFGGATGDAGIMGYGRVNDIRCLIKITVYLKFSTHNLVSLYFFLKKINNLKCRVIGACALVAILALAVVGMDWVTRVSDFFAFLEVFFLREIKSFCFFRSRSAFWVF